MDEWDHSRSRVSFSHEDGMSALLDEGGRIVRKVGIVPIMARDFQVRFVEELVARDAVIFVNQFDDTLTAARLPVVHFAEPGGSYDSYLLGAAQCSRTPLSLHVKATRGIWNDAKEFLKRGLLMCYYWKYLHGDHLLKRCFPITVREIWPGVVIGEDRIVTCASGRFTLGRDDPLTAYIYAGPTGELQAEVAANASVGGLGAGAGERLGTRDAGQGAGGGERLATRDAGQGAGGGERLATRDAGHVAVELTLNDDQIAVIVQSTPEGPGE